MQAREQEQVRELELELEPVPVQELEERIAEELERRRLGQPVVELAGRIDKGRAEEQEREELVAD